MAPEPDSYDPLYLQGIEYFNECEYFEAHEVWEELWTEYRGPHRRFYQGLIQAAVALHHFGNGNIRGARKVYFSSRKYLDDYLNEATPAYVGINLASFLKAYEECFADVIASDEEFPEIEIDVEKIPEISLNPPPAPSE